MQFIIKDFTYWRKGKSVALDSSGEGLQLVPPYLWKRKRLYWPNHKHLMMEVSYMLPIANAGINLGMYVVAILAGTLVTAGMLFLMKRPVTMTTAQKVVTAAAD